MAAESPQASGRGLAADSRTNAEWKLNSRAPDFNQSYSSYDPSLTADLPQVLAYDQLYLAEHDPGCSRCSAEHLERSIAKPFYNGVRKCRCRRQPIVPFELRYANSSNNRVEEYKKDGKIITLETAVQ